MSFQGTKKCSKSILKHSIEWGTEYLLFVTDALFESDAERAKARCESARPKKTSPPQSQKPACAGVWLWVEDYFLVSSFLTAAFSFIGAFFASALTSALAAALGAAFSPVAGARLGVLANDALANADKRMVVKSLFMESSLVEV